MSSPSRFGTLFLIVLWLAPGGCTEGKPGQEAAPPADKPASGVTLVEPQWDPHKGHDHEEEDDSLPIPVEKPPEGRRGPEITFASSAVDFGEIQHGLVPEHTFSFTNTGDMDLIIFKARPSCRCVSTIIGHERVPPGEKGEIKITYDSHGRGGSDPKRVYVWSNDPNRQRVTLHIKVHVKVHPHPTIELNPRTMNLGVMKPGEVRAADIQVRNAGDKVLTVIRIVDPPGAKSTPPPEATIGPGSTGALRIEATATTLAGVQSFRFTLHSDDPFKKKYPFFANCYVQGGPGPMLRVNAAALRLDGLGPEAARREVALYNGGRETLVVESVQKVSGDDRLSLEVEPGTRIEPGEEATGAIVFKGGGPPGSVKSRWVIRSNDAQIPERTVDIFGSVGDGASPPGGPVFLLGHGEWDFGVLDTGGGVSHGVRVFNRGSKDLVIDDVITYEESNPFRIDLPGPIPPGGSGEVRFTLPPGAPGGILDYQFEISSNDLHTMGDTFSVFGYVSKVETKFPEGSRRVTILYMADEAGEIQGCGCGSSNLGGIARRATLVRGIRKEEPSVLLVGAGDLFGMGKALFRLRAKLSAEAYSQMGCDAFAPGEMDFSFKTDFLRETLDGAGLKATNLNIRNTEDGKPFALPAVTREIGGMKVAILGLTNPEVFVSAGDPIEAVDPEEALREALPGIRKEADLVVLLAHMGREKAARIVRRVPGVDVVVVGHDEFGMDEPIREGGAVLVASGGAGQKLGYLEIALAPDGQVYAKGKRIPVSKDIRRDDAVVTLIQRYRQELRDLPLPKGAKAGMGDFAASGACKDCHAKDFEVWEASKHAKAFESLRDELNSHFDPECFKCHVVGGFDEKRAFLDEKRTPKLMGVGCESCHGPGRKHVEAEQKKATVPYKVPLNRLQSLCEECHTPDRNPGFSFDKMWEKIRHGKP